MFASDQLRGSEIVVVGAGAVGAAITYRLAQAGARVTCVERSFPGAGTSGNSFAWLNGHSKRPKSYHRINIMSIRDHLDLADELGGHWVEVYGGLHWTYADDRSKFGSLKEIVARLREWGTGSSRGKDGRSWYPRRGSHPRPATPPQPASVARPARDSQVALRTGRTSTTGPT